MQEYMKKSEILNKINTFSSNVSSFVLLKKKSIRGTIIVLLVLSALYFTTGSIKSKNISVNDDGMVVAFASLPIAETMSKKEIIAIPDGMIKANPFLPYKEVSNKAVSDVPLFDIIEPPDTVNENSDAARVMDTIVSGILYDKYSPSAILNIEGNDYLVKKGDTINNYKVLNIQQDRVVVKLGSNTYTAGIGEILTEGDINNNVISNLSKKFGGEK